MRILRARSILLIAPAILLLLIFGSNGRAGLPGQVTTKTVVIEERQHTIVDLNASSTVTRAQVLLRNLGYYHGKINGVLTEDTRKAIKRFQDENNLHKTGYLDASTAQLLGLDLVTVSGSLPVAVNDLNSYDSIVRAQIALRNMGYYHGSINGLLNDRTRDAIKNFQDDHNLRKTGYLDLVTTQMMGLDLVTVSSRETVLDLESPGTVTRAQSLLREKGYYDGPLDGVLNEGTRSAIKSFQNAHNLDDSGVLDLDTVKELGLDLP